MNIEIRPAVADDAEAIRELVRSERLNPSRLDWPNFVVAAAGERLIGTIQLRPHAPGVVELASLAVRAEYRGQRIATQLMDAALARAEGRVLAVANTRHAELYRLWGFRQVPLKRAPGCIARTFLIRQATALAALARGLKPRRLVIVERSHQSDARAA